MRTTAATVVAAIGESGTIIFPRERFGLSDGAVLALEATPEGILLRPIPE